MNILQVIDWKRAVLAVTVFALVASAGFLGTRAFFSDTETSTGNVFAAGSLDLEVGIQNRGSINPDPRSPISLTQNQALFSFGNLIPGDMEVGHFKLQSSQDAWACVAADITANYENTRLDVEEAAGDTTAGAGVNGGELSKYIEVAIWEANNNNTDGVVGTNETDTLRVMSLADFASGEYHALQDSLTGNNPLMNGVEEQYEFAYCFGKFSNVAAVQANGGTLECNGATAGNDAQTDSVIATLHFYAEQMQNNDNFVCSSLNPGPVSSGKISTVNAEYVEDPSLPYTGVYIGFTEEDVVDATAVELRLNLSDNTTRSIFAQSPVINAVNTNVGHSTGGTVIITGSRTSSSWAPQTAASPAIPNGVTVDSVEVRITLGDNTVITNTLDEASISNQALGDIIFN